MRFGNTGFRFQFRPRLLDAVRKYDRNTFFGDLSAGAIVGVVALPLALAFAIASGLKPEAGVFTAIVAGFLISALGGSRVQIGGPAGAFIVIVYGIVERYGIANLLLATMFAGVLLFAMGVARLGNLIRFIPVAIVIGFTNGIAVLIALSQVKDFLGLPIKELPADFFAKIAALAARLPETNLVTLAFGMVSLAIVWGWGKAAGRLKGGAGGLLARIPGTIIALVLGTAVVGLFGLPVETIGSRFGGIPRTLPIPSLPAFDWGTVRLLFAPTVTIALLGAIESLLCARVADSMIEDRHDPNQELMAQGIANFAAPLFGGFCATGTIARTVTNVRCGARTPVSGMMHAVTLLLIVLVLAPLAQYVPLATLAAILLFVAFNMGEWHEFIRLQQFHLHYRIILITTFVLTVVLDLTVAVQVGLILACLFFITRMSSLTRIEPVSEEELRGDGIDPRQVEVFEVFGSLFFGAVTKLEALLDPKRAVPRWLVLDLTYMVNLDSTGLESLQSLYSSLTKRGSALMLCGLQSQPDLIVRRSGFAAMLGEPGIFTTPEDAIAYLRAHGAALGAQQALDLG